MQVVFVDADRRVVEFFKDKKAFKSAKFFSKPLHELDADELKAAKSAEILSVFVSSRADAAILKNFPKLRLINARSTGYNNIDLDYSKKHKIAVANVVGYGEITVAEFAMGLLLNLTRRIASVNRRLRMGLAGINDCVGVDLYGKTVGVIGTGAIGRHFAKLANGFGCQVLAYDIFPNKDLEKQGVVKYTTLDKIFAQSNVISLHAPSTKESFHLVNKARLAKMPVGGFIINTARGELVDTEALYLALTSGKLAGYAADVVEGETTKDLHSDLLNQALLANPNVILTPHIAYNSEEAEERILSSSAKVIEDFMTGAPIKNLV